MSRSSIKNRNRRESKRYGHKQARQATRRVLEGDGHATIARGIHWSPTIEQPPVMDVPVGPPSPKKKGCKKNGYGPHVIKDWLRSDVYEWRCDEEGNLRRVFVRFGRWHPPYRCVHCHKGFYKIPRGAIRNGATEPRVTASNWVNEVKDYHYDLYNIRCRLLGLPCRCKDCNPEENPDG